MYRQVDALRRSIDELVDAHVADAFLDNSEMLVRRLEGIHRRLSFGEEVTVKEMDEIIDSYVVDTTESEKKAMRMFKHVQGRLEKSGVDLDLVCSSSTADKALLSGDTKRMVRAIAMEMLYIGEDRAALALAPECYHVANWFAQLQQRQQVATQTYGEGHARLLSGGHRAFYLVSHGLKTHPPLGRALLAGEIALGALVAHGRNGRHPKGDGLALLYAVPSDELPVVEHPLLVCPVQRVETTSTVGERPYVLVCGHFIGEQALKRLVEGAYSGEIKCPYCPSRGAYSEARPVCILP